ncbi:DsbA family protein [Calidifontibacter terrae]
MPRPDASQKLAAAKPKDNGRIKLIVATVLVVALVIGAFAAVLINSSGSTKTAAAGPTNSVADGNGLKIYPEKAQAGVPEVQLYEDFQCPICNDFEKLNGSQVMQMAQAGQIKLTVHMMTFLDNNFGNTASADAASAGFCAADAGKFPEYHSLVYANQPAKEGAGYTTELLKSLGSQAGIKGSALTTFNKCFDSGKYKKYVEATETRSGKNGVNGTPTIIINGKSTSNDKTAFNTLLTKQNSFASVVQQYAAK